MRKYREFKTYLLGKIASLRNIQQPFIEKKAVELMLEEILEVYKRLKTKEIIIECLGLVKDGHSYDIYRGFDNDYRVWLYETETPLIIKKEDINFLFKIILNLPIGELYHARYFFNKIIEEKNLDVDIEAFAGGKYRALYYFPLYIAPMKIIEKETGIIKVKICKGGGIIRLNE